MYLNMKPKRLRSFLLDRDILVDRWGREKTKSYDHLTGLIKNREVALLMLEDGRVCIESRKLKMNVFAQRNGHWCRLYEGCRMFPDGSFALDISPTSVSEKLLLDESGEPPDLLTIVAIRALAEELGLKVTEETMPTFVFKSMYTSAPHVSYSYPGLFALGPRYRMTCVLTHPSLIRENYREPSGKNRAYGLFGWRLVKGNRDPLRQTPPLGSSRETALED